MLGVSDIVTFWAGKQTRSPDGMWCHEDDVQHIAGAESLGFNLRFPVSPFVGNIVDAPVILLNLNGGYSSIITPLEFSSPENYDQIIFRVANPDSCDWSEVPTYYHGTNYGSEVLTGNIAMINACAYRSPKLKQGSAARKLANKLPSVGFHRKWLREAVIPLATTGKRFVLAHRWGLWDLPKSATSAAGVHRDLRCRAFPDVDENILKLARAFAQG